MNVMENALKKDTIFAPPVVAVERGGVEIVERLADEWRILCHESANDEPFYRPEWIAAHVRAFAPRAKLALVTARSGGRLVAVLPLAEERILFDGLPVPRLRGLSNVHSYRFDLLRAAGEVGGSAVRSVWLFLTQLRGWDILEFSYVPEGASLEMLHGMAVVDGYPAGSRESWRTPYIMTTGWDGTWEFWINRTSSKFRHTIRRITRKFNEQRPLRLERVDTADAASLQRFYDVEASGWKGREGTAIQSRPETRHFYDEIAQGAERFGYLAIYFLEIDGVTVAAHFGLRYHGRYLVTKCAYDEKFREFAPGHLIVNGILRECAESGLSEFDFLGPAMEWKEKWTSDVRRHSTFLIFRNSPYGRLLHAAHFRLRPAARVMLNRLQEMKSKLLLKRQTLYPRNAQQI